MKFIIFHIDDSASWKLVLSNIQNMINYYDAHSTSYHIELLVNSHAVKDLADNQFLFKNEIENCLSPTMTVVACQNSLRGLSIDPTDLFPHITTTPSGVVYLAEKQFSGYAYIKP